MRYLLVFLCWGLLAEVGISQTTREVPVRKVVLFSSGVGYFEHTGSLQGDGVAELRFRTAQIKDVLKSLIVQDLGGGRVGTVVYPSQDPIERTLGSFQVDLTGNPSLGDLLTQVRGTPVRITTMGRTLSGTLLGVDQQQVVVQGAVASVWILNLLSDGAVRSVRLPDVESLTLADPVLQDELEKALAALAQARNQERKTVRVPFLGTGTRQVRLGYVVEAPVWKTSYRLILPAPGKDKGLLQGWAIVENQTETDWEGVALTLVSGRPISFIQDLYQPLYLPRPVVQPEVYGGLRPQTYEQGARLEELELDASLDIDEGASERQRLTTTFGKAEGMMADMPPPPFNPAESVFVEAAGAEVGDLFQYVVGNVALPRQRSAMIPIVNEDVAVERLSIYNASVQPTHPLLGARLHNTTALHLAAGPATVFDASSYTGDARLSDLPPGQYRLLSYALDLDVRVVTEAAPMEEVIQTGRIVDGVLEATRKRTSAQTYTLVNEDGDERTVLIEHPRRSGWTLVEMPEPLESTAALHRFRVTVPAGETVPFTVREEEVLEESIALINTNESRLSYYVRATRLPEPVKAALREAMKRQAEVARLTREIQQIEQAQAAITQEQARIRENMRTVDASSDYYKRLLTKLEEQEDQIEQNQRSIENLRREQAEREQDLRAYLSRLNVR